MARLIDADALKEDLFIKFGNQLPNGLFEEIDNAPTVTTKQKRTHGEWVKSKDGYTRCSQCGSRGSGIKARFCHHCGANMRKGGEDHATN